MHKLLPQNEHIVLILLTKKTSLNSEFMNDDFNSHRDNVLTIAVVDPQINHSRLPVYLSRVYSWRFKDFTLLHLACLSLPIASCRLMTAIFESGPSLVAC